MQEFDSVSAPATDPAALCAALNARSGLGWDVVSIVASGSDVTAFLSRDSSGAATNTAAAGASIAPAAEAAPVPVAEPSGWAVSPAPVAQPTPQPASSYQPSAQPAAQPAAQPSAQAAPPPNTGVPANWYADPSGRFELRYWDGSQWTEHVARGGQQFTDPPVA